MGPHFIDRRLNPKGKSLGNRQRFLRRARRQIRDAVERSLKERKVGDFDKGQKIKISSKSTAEPRFRFDRTGGERRPVKERSITMTYRFRSTTSPPSKGMIRRTSWARLHRPASKAQTLTR